MDYKKQIMVFWGKFEASLSQYHHHSSKVLNTQSRTWKYLYTVALGIDNQIHYCITVITASISTHSNSQYFQFVSTCK